MPDIKTAFSKVFNNTPDIQKALAEWEDTEAQPVTTKTQEKQMEQTSQAYTYTPNAKEHSTFSPNDPELTVSEVVYNFVRDNPLRGRAQIVSALEKQGYKPASVNTLISQSVLCGTILRDAHGNHTVALHKFKPVTQRMVLKARKVKQKNNVGIAALKPQAKVERDRHEQAVKEMMAVYNKPELVVPAPNDIDALLNSLTFNQAIGLYKKLKTMLGEV